MKIESYTARILQFLARISWIGAAILIIMSFGDFSRNYDNFLLGIACIVNGIFMYGFGYVVEACVIYIQKNRKEEEKTRYTSVSWNQRLKEEKTK